MRSYKHTVALLRDLIASAIQGPNEGEPSPMNSDTITGVKVGVLSACHLIAAATADSYGVPRTTLYEEIGLPDGMVDAEQEHRATSIIKESYESVATSH